MAIREDEIAAKAMGINTRNMKLLAFGMGATFGGVSGTMFAAFQNFVSPRYLETMNIPLLLGRQFSEHDDAKAAAEGHDYITRARAGNHPVGNAVRRLDAVNVSTTIIRDQRPFTVVTTAQFPSLDALGTALIDAMGIDATSALTRDSSEVHWTMTIRSDRTTKDDVEDDLLALVDEPWHVVLEHGRFVGAGNFRIADPQIAVQVIDCEDPARGTPLVWSLTWIR